MKIALDDDDDCINGDNDSIDGDSMQFFLEPRGQKMSLIVLTTNVCGGWT